MTDINEIETLKARVTELEAEREALIQHKNTVLNEKRQAVEELRAAREELDSLRSSADTTQQELTARVEAAEKRALDVELNHPVDAMLDAISLDAQTFKYALAEKYKFALVDGKPALCELDGKPVEIKGKDGKPVPLPFEERAISEFLCPSYGGKDWTPYQRRIAHLIRIGKATGSGAMGQNGRGSGYSSSSGGKPATESPRQEFGLR